MFNDFLLAGLNTEARHLPVLTNPKEPPVNPKKAQFLPRKAKKLSL
jgi:hypothetical protein|tara:strand:- start:875 stop:1012 length:138 start_codon:yes stop_codon:yes gene_type:complete